MYRWISFTNTKKYWFYWVMYFYLWCIQWNKLLNFQEIIFNPKKDKNDLVQSEIVWYLFYTAYLLVNKVNVFNIWKTVARSTNEFTMSIHVLRVHSNFLDVHVSIFFMYFYFMLEITWGIMKNVWSIKLIFGL